MFNCQNPLKSSGLNATMKFSVFKELLKVIINAHFFSTVMIKHFKFELIYCLVVAVAAII